MSHSLKTYIESNEAGLGGTHFNLMQKGGRYWNISEFSASLVHIANSEPTRAIRLSCWAIVAHVFNPSTWEAEAGKSL